VRHKEEVIAKLRSTEREESKEGKERKLGEGRNITQTEVKKKKKISEG
jgi:hypothetical protein